jgi:hypothetical protein
LWASGGLGGRYGLGSLLPYGILLIWNLLNSARKSKKHQVIFTYPAGWEKLGLYCSTYGQFRLSDCGQLGSDREMVSNTNSMNDLLKLAASDQQKYVRSLLELPVILVRT